MTVLGSALGPFPFGVARDQTGSWALPFAVASVLPVFAALAVWCFGTVRARSREAGVGTGTGALGLRGKEEVYALASREGEEEEEDMEDVE